MSETTAKPNRELLNQLCNFGDGALNANDKCRLLERFRREHPEIASQIDRALLAQAEQLHRSLSEVGAQQSELKRLLDEVLAPPWHPAVFVAVVETPQQGARATVWFGGRRRVVGIADGLNLESLEAGDEVYLSDSLNQIVFRSPFGSPTVGRTAAFQRKTADGRLVLQFRDEEIVVDAAASLRSVELAAGDRLRWDDSAWMAYERIEKEEVNRFMLEEVPQASTELVGGQRENLETLLSALQVTLVAPELARSYRLDGQHTILMIGPPGCGKTLMARVAASETSRISGKTCKFAVVKPAEWEDPFVGVTQANIRHCFDTLRREAQAGCYVILFLDEIESVGRVRGLSVGVHNDKFLAALLAEIDGFTDRQNVAIICASNRKDLIDPALLERLSDIEISVNRPDMRAAREIFEIHLPADLPFFPNSTATAKTRQEIIEAAVSRLYAPNADNQLCTVKFRDGNVRVVTARDLASGRVVQQICKSAKRAAFRHEFQRGEHGLRTEDMEHAVSEAIHKLTTVLTPRNAHAYLSDLPQDNDVVSVEPIVRRVRRPHRYFNRN